MVRTQIGKHNKSFTQGGNKCSMKYEQRKKSIRCKGKIEARLFSPDALKTLKTSEGAVT